MRFFLLLVLLLGACVQPQDPSPARAAAESKPESTPAAIALPPPAAALQARLASERAQILRDWQLRVSHPLLRSELTPKLNEEQQAFLAGLPTKTLRNSRQMDHGWLAVPEDWQDPASPMIYVFYHRLRTLVAAPKPPIIYYNGGPGDYMEDGYISMMCNYVQDRDFVIIHQRGTGCSSPMPAGADPESIRRLRLYLSRSIVQDSEALRRQLYGENSRWTVVGQSYGSLIGHRYLELAPSSISSLHLHGYAPLLKPQADAELRLRSHYVNLQRFFKKYPLAQRRLQAIRAFLKTPAARLQLGELTMQGEHLMGYIGLVMLSEDSTWFELNYLLQMVCPGTKVKEEALLNLAEYFNSQILKLDQASNPLNIVFNRIESYGCGQQSLSAFYTQIFDRMAQEGNDPRQWLLGEEALAHFAMHSPAVQAADTLDLGPLDLLDPRQLALNLKMHPHITFRLYGGEFDPLSPPEIYQDMVKLCGDRLHFTIIPASGHSGYMQDQPFWKELRETLPLPASPAPTATPAPMDTPAPGKAPALPTAA